jgi:hypothetical protein
MLHYIKGPCNILAKNLSRLHHLVTLAQIAKGKKFVDPVGITYPLMIIIIIIIILNHYHKGLRAGGFFLPPGSLGLHEPLFVITCFGIFNDFRQSLQSHQKRHTFKSHRKRGGWYRWNKKRDVGYGLGLIGNINLRSLGPKD